MDDVYDRVRDVKKLGDSVLNETLGTIGWRYGYTHDLAWSIIGREECIPWDDWKSHYYGNMLEVILLKLKENEEEVLKCVREILRFLDA